MTQEQYDEYSAVLASVGEAATRDRQDGLSEETIEERANIRFEGWMEAAGLSV